MKSKLTMLVLTGALALSAFAPGAMAHNQKGNAARPANSVTKSAAAKASVKAPVKKYPTAIPSKDNGKCTIALDRAVC